jgi:hypothetical protein
MLYNINRFLTNFQENQSNILLITKYKVSFSYGSFCNNIHMKEGDIYYFSLKEKLKKGESIEMVSEFDRFI